MDPNRDLTPNPHRSGDTAAKRRQDKIQGIKDNLGLMHKYLKRIEEFEGSHLEGQDGRDGCKKTVDDVEGGSTQPTHMEGKNGTNIMNDAKGDDSVQFLVSTVGEPIHGRNWAQGNRAIQVGGTYTPDSFQQLSRGLADNDHQETGPTEQSPAATPEAEPSREGFCGPGYTLAD